MVDAEIGDENLVLIVSVWQTLQKMSVRSRVWAESEPSVRSYVRTLNLEILP